MKVKRGIEGVDKRMASIYIDGRSVDLSLTRSVGRGRTSLIDDRIYTRDEGIKDFSSFAAIHKVFIFSLFIHAENCNILSVVSY